MTKRVLDVRNSTRARNAEHYQLYGTLLNTFNEDLATKFGVTSYRARFATSYGKENDAYLQNQAYEGTKGVEEASNKCNRLFRSLDLAVQSKQASENDAELAPAERVAFAMKPYKKAPGKPHAENIAMIKDMINLLESDKYSADMTTLGLSEKLTALKESLTAFEEAYLSRSGEKLARSTADKMKLVRPVVEQDFAALAEVVSAIYIVATAVEKDAEKSAELESVIDKMNAAINEFHIVLSRRGAGNNTKPTDTSNEPEGEEPEEGTDVPFEPVEPGEDPGKEPGEGEEEPETPDVV